MDALFRAMEELSRRKSSLRISPESNKTDNGSGSPVNPAVIAAPDSDIGKRAPSLVRMDSVGRCMDCGSSFGVMRRKHHCHACGSVSMKNLASKPIRDSFLILNSRFQVVCGKCSGHKMPLPCEENKVCRVCMSCYKILIQRSAPNSPGLDSSAPSFARGKGVLEVRTMFKMSATYWRTLILIYRCQTFDLDYLPQHNLTSSLRMWTTFLNPLPPSDAVRKQKNLL